MMGKKVGKRNKKECYFSSFLMLKSLAMVKENVFIVRKHQMKRKANKWRVKSIVKLEKHY